MAISFLEDLLAEVSHEAAFMSLALLFYFAVLFFALFLCSGAGSGVIHCRVFCLFFGFNACWQGQKPRAVPVADGGMCASGVKAHTGTDKAYERMFAGPTAHRRVRPL